METANQPSMAPLPHQGRGYSWRSARLACLLSALLAGGAGLLGLNLIRERHLPATQGRDDPARLETDFRLGTERGSPAGSLPEILTHPVLVPTHNHPLLGRQAPDFTLEDPEGKTWSLRKLLADGPVVLIFYHTYCDLCDRQLFTDKNDLPLFSDVGARVVAISADAPEVTRQRFERFGSFGFPVLSDPGDKAAKAYQVFRRAQDGKTAEHLLHGTFIIDRHGTVQWVNVGDAPFHSNAALLYILAKIEGRLPPARPEP